MSIRTEEEFYKSLNEEQVIYFYSNQLFDNIKIPPIEKIKDEGEWVYKIYCYKNDDGKINYNKYLCRVFKDPHDPFWEHFYKSF